MYRLISTNGCNLSDKADFCMEVPRRNLLTSVYSTITLSQVWNFLNKILPRTQSDTRKHVLSPAMAQLKMVSLFLRSLVTVLLIDASWLRQVWLCFRGLENSRLGKHRLLTSVVKLQVGLLGHVDSAMPFVSCFGRYSGVRWFDGRWPLHLMTFYIKTTSVKKDASTSDLPVQCRSWYGINMVSKNRTPHKRAHQTTTSAFVHVSNVIP